MSMLYKSIYHSPLGTFILISDSRHLLKLCPAELYKESEDVIERDSVPIRLAKHWLDAYFHDSKPSISDLPLRPVGTAFQQKCWQLLCKIPYGHTCTYKDIANEMVSINSVGKMSCQAVGQVIKRNPISIIIPCHRVIGSDGSLTGYSGGLDLKQALLIHEHALKTEL